ncbi:group II truncated hemoglobin [Ideonella dechloratans]|uniref:Group II truncated hemoglobin n=1 Tax=Ideonella dechloratans TaxID=36863 RepID=A0A643F7P7_IDEDE|nr:group II truncated hemoglobin [Ideonella dechloratans]KAB0576601.1 group II truncated hemoglobin [Ideonella dechloratans]UFU10169.1 group II truncated hemoglobin [Ideonella dechloratans]
MNTPTLSPYDRLGGEAGVRRLVERFYALMDELPEAYTVRQIHPESLAGSADSLLKFLSGWFGGPPLYTAEKGHPRLRMRHLPYRVGPVERDEWMLCMRQALAETVDDAPLRAVLEKAFADMADHMVNTTGETCACSAPATSA